MDATMDVIGLGTLAMDVLIKVDQLPKADSFCVVEQTTYAPGAVAPMSLFSWPDSVLIASTLVKSLMIKLGKTY